MNEMNEIKEEKMKQKQNRKEEMLEYFQLADPKKGNVIGIYRPIYTECDGYLSPHKMDLDDEWGRKDMKDLDLSFLKDHLKKIRSTREITKTIHIKFQCWTILWGIRTWK